MEHLHQDERISAAIGDIFYAAVVHSGIAEIVDDGVRDNVQIADLSKLKKISDDYAPLFSKIAGVTIAPQDLVFNYLERVSTDEECSS